MGRRAKPFVTTIGRNGFRPEHCANRELVSLPYSGPTPLYKPKMKNQSFRLAKHNVAIGASQHAWPDECCLVVGMAKCKKPKLNQEREGGREGESVWCAIQNAVVFPTVIAVLLLKPLSQFSSPSSMCASGIQAY